MRVRRCKNITSKGNLRDDLTMEKSPSCIIQPFRRDKVYPLTPKDPLSMCDEEDFANEVKTPLEG